MNVGLFVPCYIDQFYPDVAVATVELLESVGAVVQFPEGQTCCGQPMSNTGCSESAKPLARRFLDLFADYEYVVCPSGSCTSMVRNHFDELVGDDPRLESLKSRTYELCEFLHDVCTWDVVPKHFPFRVGLHQACHGLRELRLGPSSEQNQARVDKVRSLLETVPGLEFVTLQRADECCGFGGTFAVNERAVSVAMGEDRLADHAQAGAEVLVASDMSCLMHLGGLIRRRGTPLAVMHVAQVLAGRQPSVSVKNAVASLYQDKPNSGLNALGND